MVLWHRGRHPNTLQSQMNCGTMRLQNLAQIPPNACSESPDNNTYPKNELHKVLIKMFNPLPVCKWHGQKISSLILFDTLFMTCSAFLATFYFFLKEKQREMHLNTRKKGLFFEQLLGKNIYILESKICITSFIVHLPDPSYWTVLSSLQDTNSPVISGETGSWTLLAWVQFPSSCMPLNTMSACLIVVFENKITQPTSVESKDSEPSCIVVWKDEAPLFQ